MTIEDQVRAAYYVPDPTSYSAPNTHSQHLVEPKPGGHISSSQHASALDYHHKARAHVPGPGSYDTPDTKDWALPEGGRLNRNPPKDFTKPFDEYPRPEPGTYGIPHDPTRPRQLNGQFSKEPRVSKYIVDEINRAKTVPGPIYEVSEAYDSVHPFLPEGGRCMGQAKPAGYFEAASKLSQTNPDPGSYNLPGSINGHRAVGQVVYRYESATSAETRELVAKMAGKSDEAPGPGHYQLPEPPPIHPTPTIKGRSIPAMPHPFQHGCRPDYAGRFVPSTSVLHKSSAGQIFGTGVNRSAHGSKRTNLSSRPSSGDRLKESEVPVGLLAAEQPEADIDWKAGGFSALRKARSAPVIKPEHPSVMEASKCYPKLQRQHRDRSTFLPCASRRSEAVATHRGSCENSSLKSGKWQLGALATGIQRATAAALEPLDEERLKREAMMMMQDKARARMRLEGVSKGQQQIIMEEMRSVLEERVRPSSMPSGCLPPSSANLDANFVAHPDANLGAEGVVADGSSNL